MVGNMDGSMVVELLKLETTPHHLTMDPIRGDLYWIGSVGAHTDIYTCSRNGDGIVLFLNSGFSVSAVKHNLT